jgi:hypothetical protein
VEELNNPNPDKPEAKPFNHEGHEDHKEVEKKK